MPELMERVKACRTCTQFIPSAETSREGFCMIAFAETLQSQWTEAAACCAHYHASVLDKGAD